MENHKNAILNIEGLTVEYHSSGRVIHAVNNLNLSIDRGETLGLVGETGAGKTTTALAVLGILPQPLSKIVSGSIYFRGENPLKKSTKQLQKIRGKEIAMIFQDPMTSLDPVKTVGKQIEEMIGLHTELNRKEIKKRAGDMLEIVGIERSRSKEYPHQFSGGMKQRVMIAMALSCNPGLLIADEPTTALDVTIQAQVLELMKDLKKSYSMSMIMITHDLGIVAETCDKVSVMYAGEIVEHGTVKEVFDNPVHPYTKALFDSVPKLDEEIEELKVISGLTPDPTRLPLGCPFHPRCPYAEASCAENAAPVELLPGDHWVKCRRDV